MTEQKKRGRGWAIASLVLGCIAWVVGGLLVVYFLMGPNPGRVGGMEAPYRMAALATTVLGAVALLGLLCAVVALLRRNRSRLLWSALALNVVPLAAEVVLVIWGLVDQLARSAT